MKPLTTRLSLGGVVLVCTGLLFCVGCHASSNASPCGDNGEVCPVGNGSGSSSGSGSTTSTSSTSGSGSASGSSSGPVALTSADFSVGGQSNVSTSSSTQITIGVIGGVDSSTVQTNVGSASTITITDSAGHQIPITASSNGAGISVSLGCNLYPSTTYTISVSGAKTEAGEPVSGSTTFTTANSYQGSSCEDPVLTWTAPTQNTDGSALTNLAGYQIFYVSGTCNNASQPIVLKAGGGNSGTPASGAQDVQIANPSTTTYTLNQQLPAGNARFVIEAYNSNNQYSVPSNEACTSMP